MGIEKRTTQPNLGVRECFLEKMVLELVSKDIWEFERRRRFQAEETAQEPERICMTSARASSSTWLRFGVLECWPLYLESTGKP